MGWIEIATPKPDNRAFSQGARGQTDRKSNTFFWIILLRIMFNVVEHFEKSGASGISINKKDNTKKIKQNLFII